MKKDTKVIAGLNVATAALLATMMMWFVGEAKALMSELSSNRKEHAVFVTENIARDNTIEENKEGLKEHIEKFDELHPRVAFGVVKNED